MTSCIRAAKVLHVWNLASPDLLLRGSAKTFSGCRRFNLLDLRDDDGDGEPPFAQQGEIFLTSPAKSQLPKLAKLYSSIADMRYFWAASWCCMQEFCGYGSFAATAVLPQAASGDASDFGSLRLLDTHIDHQRERRVSPSDELRCLAEDKCSTSTQSAQQQLATSQQPKKPSRQTSSLSKAELKRRARQRSQGNKAPEKPTLPPGYVSLPQTLLFPNLETALFSFFISGIVQASASIIGAWSSGVVDELGALALAVSALLLVTFVLVYEFVRLRSFSKDCREATFYASPPVATTRVDDPLLGFSKMQVDQATLSRLALPKHRAKCRPQRTEAYVRPALLYQELVQHCLFGR